MIRSAKKMKPITVVPVSQDMVLNFSLHFAKFFKKTMGCGQERLKMREV